MKPEQEKREQKRRERPGVHESETTPAEERGERLDTGKAIARSGGEDGHVPGAEPAHESDEPSETTRGSS